MNLWRVTRRVLLHAEDSDFINSSLGDIMQKDSEARPKYFEMKHIFWVKVSLFIFETSIICLFLWLTLPTALQLSDFMDIVPHVPHLHGLQIKFMKMHVDEEPGHRQSSLSDQQQSNGHLDGGSNGGGDDGVGGPNGFGSGRQQPIGTYV